MCKNRIFKLRFLPCPLENFEEISFEFLVQKPVAQSSGNSLIFDLEVKKMMRKNIRVMARVWPVLEGRKREKFYLKMLRT